MSDAATLVLAEVARLLRVTPATLTGHMPKMIAKDGFPAPRQIGRCRRWRRQDIEDWLARRPVGGARSASRPSILDTIDAL